MSIKALGLISANYNSQDFGSLTEKRTVATLPFGGRYRIIDFPLSNMVNSGITTVGLITPYYYRSIMDHVGVGKPWGLARKIGGLFVLPGSAIGERSKGSKFLMKDLIRNRRILDSCEADYVLLSDSSTVMNCDFQPFLKAHAESEAQISLMYAKKKSNNEGIYLELTKSGALKGIRFYGEETTENRFLGVICMNRKFLIDCLTWYEALDNDDIMEILAHDFKKFSFNAFEFKGYNVIIDNLKDFKRANNDLLEHPIRTELFDQEYYPILTKVQDEAPTIYRKSASVSKSLVAAGCVIEGTVENSIIFRSVHIKKGAVVRNSIIMQGSIIETNAVVENAICDKYSHVGRKAQLVGGDQRPAVLGKNKLI